MASTIKVLCYVLSIPHKENNLIRIEIEYVKRTIQETSKDIHIIENCIIVIIKESAKEKKTKNGRATNLLSQYLERLQSFAVFKVAYWISSNSSFIQ